MYKHYISFEGSQACTAGPPSAETVSQAAVSSTSRYWQKPEAHDLGYCQSMTAAVHNTINWLTAGSSVGKYV